MLSFRDLSTVIKADWRCQNPSILVQGMSIDSRKIEAGDLFAAIKTEKNDGHLYLDEVFRKGASGALISRAFFLENLTESSKAKSNYQNLLVVEDPVSAMTQIARWQRMRFNPTTVGITGSVGKSSTKDFLAYLLGLKAPTLSTVGNLNNQLGLPMMLMKLHQAHRYFVAELGASAKGDIGYLADIAQPDLGIITQVAPAHLKGFGTLQNVYDTKCELFDLLQPKSIVILPEHDQLLIRRAERRELIPKRVGFSSAAEYSVKNIQMKSGWVQFSLNQRKTFRFPASAYFLAKNAAMAIAAAESLGISLNEIPESWEDLKLPKGRFETKIFGKGLQVIDDSYNASPGSFSKAIDAFAQLPHQGRKFLFISDMLELGPEEQKYHEVLGRQIANYSFEGVIGYGPLTKSTLTAVERSQRQMSEINYFEKINEAAEYLIGKIKPTDCILIKASRGMGADQVLKYIESQFGAPVSH